MVCPMYEIGKMAKVHHDALQQILDPVLPGSGLRRRTLCGGEILGFCQFAVTGQGGFYFKFP